MQNSKHEIDDLFRTNLTGFEVPPPPTVWDRVATSMGISKRKRRAILIWSLSGAASLLFAFLMGWYLSNQPINNEEYFAQIQELKSELSKQVIHHTLAQPELVLHFERIKFQGFAPLIALPILIEKENVKQTPIFLACLKSRKPVPIENNSPVIQLINSTQNFFTSTDEVIIESNLLAVNVDAGNDPSWALGLQGSPVLHFDQIQFGYSMDAAPVDENMLSTYYSPKVSGGISVAYNVGNRLSIVSGANYSEIAQTNANVSLSFAGHNWLGNSDMAGDVFVPEAENTISTSASNNLVFNTQIGLANIAIPAGTELASTKALYTTVPEIAHNYDYTQQARYIEIPMLMRYKILQNRLGLHLVGGVNTNVLLSNIARLENQKQVLGTGKIEGFRQITFSSSLGMGMNYELTQRFNLTVEPTFKIQLNSLNTQQNFNARPYAFGIFSGIAYQF